MSDERDSDVRFMDWILLLVMATWFVYLEVDSRIQLSQLRDLQRRIGTIEEGCK